jgi:LysM repeat protein
MFGNAIGNSITSALTPKSLGEMAPPVKKSDKQASADSSEAAPSDELEEITVTAQKIDNNPTDAIRSGSEVSPDEQRAEQHATEPQKYVVARGDSYARIAREKYGDERYAELIMQANGVDPTHANIHGLQIGTELELPDLSQLSDGERSGALRAGGTLISNDQAETDKAREAQFAGQQQPSAQPPAGPATAGPEVRGSPVGQTYIQGFGEIPSYRGEFPSPLHLMWYVPQDASELFKGYYSPTEVRGWLREAAEYHGVPYELSAAIMQQENPPNALWWQKIGQFGERSLTTALAWADEVAFGLVPDKFSGGSAGFANMSRGALRDAAAYVNDTLGYEPVPPEIQSRVFGWDQDFLVSGDDWHNDLYFMNARLRQLIDVTTGTRGYSGPLSRDQVFRISAGYNGSGPAAVKYGNDTLRRIDSAAAGTEPLYFYERP